MMLSPHRSLRAGTAALACLIAAIASLALAAGSGTARAATSSFAPQCANPNVPATRNPANPLMLATPPAAGDPLDGAHFFVAGPARGTAAGAIAQLLGYGTGQALASGQPLANFSDTLSWAQFETVVARKLPAQSPSVQHKIELLEKIADEPTPLRISSFSAGGTPAAVYSQTRKLFCTIMQADPHTVPIVSTYFLHSELGGCSTTAQIDADAPTFKSQINAMAEAIGRRPIVLFLELDAVGSSDCMTHAGSIGAWESLMKYEATKFESLPHTVVYLEGGYSDSNNPAYAAKVLNAAGVQQIQGFFTNDTHLQWTANELKYAKAVSARTAGAHFVINTSSNGRGPLLNAHPAAEGVEDLCNPPNRGLGIPDTTTPGLNPDLDALLWVVPPGNSSGACNGGTASGTFWTARAEALAANANLQLGPGSRSQAY
jgi:hypothetical protein